MCGRFAFINNLTQLKEQFEVEDPTFELTYNYNVSPSQIIICIVRDNNSNKLAKFRWGLIPFWAKDEKIGNKLINARSETIHEKNSFKYAFKKRRCLIVASGFFEWMKAVCPISFVLLGVCYAVILLSFHIDIDDVSSAGKRLKEELAQIGPMSLLEKKILLILILTVCLWIFASQILGLAVISLLSVVVLFSFRCLAWDDVHSYVNWGVILMYGGAVVAAKALEQTGATIWLVGKFLEVGPQTPIFTLIIVALLAKFLTEGVSNVACVAIILPVALSLCATLGIAPVIMVYFVAVSSGLAFILPISSPPNAIAYSSGYYEINKVIKPGLVLNILTLIIFILMAIIYWPIIGLSIG